MTFDWGGGGGGGGGGERIREGSGFYIYAFCCSFEQAHLCVVSGLLFDLFVKLLVFLKS